MPSVGRIEDLANAAGGRRAYAIDQGYRKGDTVSPYYDAMLAKGDRLGADASGRHRQAQSRASGNRRPRRHRSPTFPFLSALVTHPDVRANAIDTNFIERELKNLTSGVG